MPGLQELIIKLAPILTGVAILLAGLARLRKKLHACNDNTALGTIYCIPGLTISCSLSFVLFCCFTGCRNQDDIQAQQTQTQANKTEPETSDTSTPTDSRRKEKSQYASTDTPDQKQSHVPILQLINEESLTVAKNPSTDELTVPDALRAALFRQENTMDEVVLANTLTVQSNAPFEHAVMIDALAAMSLDRTLERYDDVPGDCLRALAGSPKGVPAPTVFNQIDGGAEFAEIVASKEVLSSLVDAIVAFRDAGHDHHDDVSPTAALTRAQKAIMIRFFSWGGKTPPSLHEISWNTLIIGDEYHKVAEYVRKQLPANNKYEVESHVRLITHLARRGDLSATTVYEVVLHAFDVDREINLDERLWVAERVLARLVVDSASKTSRQPQENVFNAKTIHPSKDATENVAAARSLPELMQADGLTYGVLDLPKFIKSKIGPSESGQLDGSFVISEIPVYLLPGFIDNEISVKVVLPFRLYKSESVFVSEKSKDLTGASLMTVNRANIRDLWCMTKNNTLAQCTPREAQIVVARNGMLFYGEAETSELIFGGILSDSFREDLEALPYNSFDPKGDGSKAIAEIEIEKLTFGPALEWQDSWGYYRRDAMMENDLDSDFIVNWNATGALTGTTPDYFRPSKSQNPIVVSARLIRATLQTPDGERIAEYKLKR